VFVARPLSVIAFRDATSPAKADKEVCSKQLGIIPNFTIKDSQFGLAAQSMT
jgi:hypothetical protein